MKFYIVNSINILFYSFNLKIISFTNFMDAYFTLLSTKNYLW